MRPRARAPCEAAEKKGARYLARAGGREIPGRTQFPRPARRTNTIGPGAPGSRAHFFRIFPYLLQPAGPVAHFFRIFSVFFPGTGRGTQNKYDSGCIRRPDPHRQSDPDHIFGSRPPPGRRTPPDPPPFPAPASRPPPLRLRIVWRRAGPARPSGARWSLVRAPGAGSRRGQGGVGGFEFSAFAARPLGRRVRRPPGLGRQAGPLMRLRAAPHGARWGGGIRPPRGDPRVDPILSRSAGRLSRGARGQPSAEGCARGW